MKRRGIINAELIKYDYGNISNISQTEFASMWRAIALETWCQLFVD